VIVIAAWKQKRLRPGEPPIRTQDTQKLRRQHHIAIPRALAVTHQNDATAAVDICDPEPSDFRGAKPGGIGSRQRGAALQARDGFEKSHDLIGAEHNWCRAARNRETTFHFLQ